MADSISLKMGFINTPYTAESIARPATAARAESRRQRRRSFSKTITAEDVAAILEAKYQVLDEFTKLHVAEIQLAILSQFERVAGDVTSGARRSSNLGNLLKPATKEIEAMFKKFLDTEEMNGRVPGVPTKAALTGVRHGRGSKTMQGTPRPSFIDTGIYRASFRAWVD
jgi:hypothetical protein